MDWAKGQFKELLDMMASVKKDINTLDRDIVELKAQRAFAVTWPQLIASAASVVGLCLLITWKGVDRAEAASARAISDSRTETSRQLIEMQAKVDNAQKLLLQAAQRDAKTVRK